MLQCYYVHQQQCKNCLEVEVNVSFAMPDLMVNIPCDRAAVTCRVPFVDMM